MLKKYEDANAIIFSDVELGEPDNDLGSSIVDTETDDEYVIHWGKIFQAGDYPDKKFSITAEELREAAEAFTPVDADIEHRPTILDGHLGKLLSVKIDPSDPTVLLGGYANPMWLEKLDEGNRKVSLAWTPGPKKRIFAISRVINPRIKDAVLMSAFSADQVGLDLDEDGQFTDTDDIDPYPTVDFSGKTLSSANKKTIQAIHDNAAMLPDIICDPDNLTDDMREQIAQEYIASKYGYSFSDFESKILIERNDNPMPNTPAGASDNQGTALADIMVQLAQLKAENEKLKSFNDRVAQDRQKEQAALFADKELKEGRIMPSDVEMVKQLYIQFAKDDAKDENENIVTFSEFGNTQVQMRRIQAFSIFMATRPSHQFLKQEMIAQVKDDGYKLFSVDTPKENDKDAEKATLDNLRQYSTILKKK